jgi:CubicO group peptidase (beta-lactamase class C family)
VPTAAIRFGRPSGAGPNERVICDAWRARSAQYELTEEDLDCPLNGRQWDYVNGWWQILRRDGGHDIAAIGRFGQFIYISPRNNIVIVRSGLEDDAPSDFDTAGIFFHVADILVVPRTWVFIDSKKSQLVLVCLSLSSRKSMASETPVGERMRRSTKIFYMSAFWFDPVFPDHLVKRMSQGAAS